MQMFLRLTLNAIRTTIHWSNKGDLIDESGNYIVDESGNKILVVEK